MACNVTLPCDPLCDAMFCDALRNAKSDYDMLRSAELFYTPCCAALYHASQTLSGSLLPCSTSDFAH
eukprot:4314007-Pyramimonas_sp.AAC.1